MSSTPDPVTVTISAEHLVMLDGFAFAQLEAWRREDPTRRSTDVVVFPGNAEIDPVIVRLYPDAEDHPAKTFRAHAQTFHEAAAIALREARS